MRTRLAAVLVAVLLLVSGADRAAERPRVGLVLSGGGARGAAHVGVLEVLEESRIPVDCIVGTSMGSIVGGLYAAGMSPAEIRAAMTGTDWAAIFRDRPDRAHRYFRRKEDDVDFPVRYQLHLDGGEARLPLGVIQGQRLTNRLERFEERLGAGRDFDAFPIPFRAVATDVETGEALVLSRGDLAQALRASMSIPGVFRPVDIDGRLYVDGGVVANLPVGILKESFDVDVVVAVDISTPLRDREIESYLAVVRRMMRFLTQGNVERDRALLTGRDLLLVPDLGTITTADFERSGEAIELGRRAAADRIEELRRLSVPEETFARYLARQRRPPRTPPAIRDVEILDAGPLRPETVRAFVESAASPERPLDEDRLEQGLVRLHGIGVHDPVSYDTVRDPGGDTATLRIRAPRRRIGLTTLQFGLEIEDDFEGGNAYTLAARHQRLAVNPRGAEWRNELRIGDTTGVSSEFYQPIDRRLRYFIAPTVGFVREDAPLVVDGQPLALVRFTSWGGGIEVGRALGTWGELRLGLRRTEGDVEIAIGPPDLPGRDVAVAAWQARLRFDTLDAPVWPSRGALGTLAWSREVEDLGGETRGERLDAEIDWALSIGRTRFVPGIDVSVDLDDGPAQGIGAELGGLFRLSGYAPLELLGAESALGRLIVYTRLNRSPLRLIPAGWYAGVSLEAGNVFAPGASIDAEDLLYGGAAFLGANTPLGAMLVGYGVTEPGRERFYLSFGRSFL